jgi:hypothetical protein
MVRDPGYNSRGPGFDSRSHQIFWEVVGLERGPLSLVSITEELIGRNNSCSGLETREYGREDQLGWPRETLYQRKLALTSPTGGSRSVGVVLSWTKPQSLFVCWWIILWNLSLFIYRMNKTTERLGSGGRRCWNITAVLYIRTEEVPLFTGSILPLPRPTFSTTCLK